MRATPQAAQADAENLVRALIKLGYDEQRDAEVSAHALLDNTQEVVGWHGCVNLTWFAFANPQVERAMTGTSMPYQLTDPTA